MFCGAIVLHNIVKPIFVGLPCFFPDAHIIYSFIKVGVTMPVQVNFCQIFMILMHHNFHNLLFTKERRIQVRLSFM